MDNRVKKFLISKNYKVVFAYFLILLLVVSFTLILNIPDPDIWSRLIMGSHVINHGSVMYHDIVSYTQTHIWYDHEWLSSALFYVVLANFGYIGATFLKIILSFTSIILIGLNLKRYDKCFRYTFIYLVFYCILANHCVFFTFLRCQNFTFIFYPLLLLILEKYRKEPDSKAIYFIPIIFIFWLNMHGGSVYGLFILFLYAIGSFLNKKPFKKYIYIFIISCIFYLINPWGISFIKFLLSAVFLNRIGISEWRSPFVFVPAIRTVVFLFPIISLYLFGTLYDKFKKFPFDWVKCLILLSTFIMYLTAAKHTTLFLISSAVFLFPDFVKFIKFYLKCLGKPGTVLKFTNIALIIGIIWFNIYSMTSFPLKSSWYTPVLKIPKYALQFLKDNSIKGNIFLPFYWAGLCAYKNYPDLKIFIDGRQEQVYDYNLFKKHFDILANPSPESIKMLSVYKTDVILLDNKMKLNWYLQNHDYFKLIYQDDLVSLYFAPHLIKNNFEYSVFATDYTVNNIFKPNYNF